MRVEGSVRNRGWALERVDFRDDSVPEELRIRGFKIDRLEQEEVNCTEPGKFSLTS